MKSKFKLTSFKDIELQEVDWLWKPYFPLGKISFIAGDPGVGKSYITAYLASIISKGERFPFSNIKVPQGEVIIQNGEDGAGDTIKKRLTVFDANCEKVHIIELEKEHEMEEDLLLTDIDELDNILNELKPKLVVFDPITAFIGKGVSTNSAVEVRRCLKPIGKLAEKYNCAIVFVIHRGKGTQGGNQLHRMLGSVDFGGIARSVVSIGISPKNKEEKLLMHTKHNLTEKGLTIAFKILDDDGIIWLGTREYLQDDEILNNDNMGIKSTARDVAKDFIIDYLEEKGKSKYEDMVSSASKYSISEKTLERARNDLKEENIIDKERLGNNIYWYLSENVSPIPQGV